MPRNTTRAPADIAQVENMTSFVAGRASGAG